MVQWSQPSPYAWFNTSGKSGNRRRHCMQEIKATSSDSNPGAPNQYTHPQINFTRGHASLENGKTLLAQKEIHWVCICSWSFFLLGFQFSLHAIKKILFQTHLLTCKCHPVRSSVITIIETCTSTPTPKLILRVSTQAGRKENNGWWYEK